MPEITRNFDTQEVKVKHFYLGNWLRGYFEGDFSSEDEAWSYLSNRFLLSFPTTGTGRYVSMAVREKNKYGIEQIVLCREPDLTEINDLSEDDVISRCEKSDISIKF